MDFLRSLECILKRLDGDPKGLAVAAVLADGIGCPAEIARLTGISKHTVRRRLERIQALALRFLPRRPERGNVVVESDDALKCTVKTGTGGG